MSNTEKFLFEVEAETQKATSKLGEIYRLMKNIEGLNAKGSADYYTTNQKDMDKNMHSMSKLSKIYKQTEKDLDALQEKMNRMSNGIKIPEGATKEQRDEIEKLKQVAEEHAQSAIQQQRALQREYTRTLVTFRELASFEQNYSKNFKHGFSSNDLYNLPQGDQNFDRARKAMEAMADGADKVESKLNDVKAKIQEVNKLDRRSDSLSRRAQASNYMSHQQASSFIKDHRTTNEEYVNERKNNLDYLTRMGQERTSITKQIKDIETNPEATQHEIDKKIALQQTIASMDKEMEARMELNNVLNRTISNMERYNQRVTENGGVEVKPERGTFRGMVYERAPAIGLALGGAMAGVAGSLYSQGASINQSIRDDVISVGQHTGTDGADWRTNIRDNALEAGLQDKLGFKGQDMLAFQQNYLSNEGFNGMDDLNTAMQNQAVFSRSTGIDQNTTKDFFNTAFSSGAVSGTQVRDIQDAFIGAIKQSGMEGREKDQLKALQGLLGSVSNGRSLSNDEVMNVMGLQSVLAQSGVRSLQGEQGGQLMSNLNDGIRQGFNNPAVRLMFGQGTKYQGLAGRFELRKQMDKGISDPENISTIARAAETAGPDENAQNEAFATAVQQALGTDITAEQAEGLMDLHRQDKLDQDHIKSVLEGDKAVGGKEGDKKLEQYQGSHEAIDNQSEATTAKQATELYDLGEPLRKVNDALGVLPPALYTLTVAVGALTAAIIASGGSFLGSSVLRKGMGKKMKGGKGGPEISGTNLGGDKKGPKGGGGGPTIVDSKGNPIGTNTTEQKGWFGRTKDTIGGWFTGNKNKPDGDGGPKPKGPTPEGGGPKPKGPTPEGEPKSFFSKVKEKSSGLFGAAKEKTGGFFNAAKEKVGGWFSKGGPKGGSGIVEGGATGAAGGLKGFLGKGAGFLSKAALPLSLAFGAHQIMTAEEGKKPEAIGSVGGGILGGMGGGAAAGAALGSVVPGLGTVIGGIGGSIIGGIAGSSVGGWIGSKFNGEKKLETPEEVAQAKETLHKAFTIGEDKPKDEEGKEGSGFVKKQLDRENTDTKARAESKRGDNISQERELLKYYENLLNRAQALLDQARMQNGIMGTMQAGGGMMGGDGTGAASPVVGNSNSEKVWNFFAGKGMSEGAIAGIMGNLQQESQLDPTAPNGGLAQWLGPRRKALNSYAQETGGDVNSMETQLNFLWKELSSGQFGSIDELNKLNPTEAAKYFEKHYEKAGKPMMEKRIGYANDWYNQYGNGKSPQMQSNAGTNNASSTNNNNNNIKVNSNINVKVSGDDSVSKKVNDSKDLSKLAADVQKKIYGSLGFFSQETKRA